MFYDPRILLGMMFTLIGTILTAFGLSTRTNADVYAKSLGIDANLWWGLALLAFGIFTLTLGRRAQALNGKTRRASRKPAENRKHLTQKEACRLILPDRLPLPGLTPGLLFLAFRDFPSVTPHSH